MSTVSLPTVREFMSTDLHVLHPDMGILDAVDLLLTHRISGAPVVQDGKLVGILSEKDCLQLLTEGADAELPVGTVGEYMVTDLTTVHPDMDIYYAAGIFLTHVFRRLPVMAGDQLVGLISRRDILRAVQANYRREIVREPFFESLPDPGVVGFGQLGPEVP